MMNMKILEFTMPTAKAEEGEVVDEVEDLSLPEVAVEGIPATKRLLIKKRRSVERKDYALNANQRITA